MWAHLESCAYQKYECERCEATVIRKIADKHDCFQSVTERLKKLERTIAYVRERWSGSQSYLSKTNWVSDEVKKNLIKANKRLDRLMYPEGKDINPKDVYHRYDEIGI